VVFVISATVFILAGIASYLVLGSMVNAINAVPGGVRVDTYKETSSTRFLKILLSYHAAYPQSNLLIVYLLIFNTSVVSFFVAVNSLVHR